MGFKRPFDCEEIPELPFKQSRQVEYVDKITLFGRPVHRATSQEHDVTEDHEGSYTKPKHVDTFESQSVSGAPNMVKNFALSAQRSWFTYDSVDDGFGSQFEAYSSDFLENAESDLARRLEAYEEDYSSYLDSTPKKIIPLGPNHQASIPMWSEPVHKNHLEQKDTLDSSISVHSESDNYKYSDSDEMCMGTCIIPMPDVESSAYNNDEIGGGRKDCCCLDKSSDRCMQQHIMEAQERLRKSLGDEKFADLGFYEMGEKVMVTHKWTREEERDFHAVVNSNPLSLGKNFWKLLSVVFPTRSSKEIVSYYFNVFMLRRRASQNRSNFLDIDSDDDELHGISREPSYRPQVIDEDDDDDFESFDQHEHSGLREDTYAVDGEDDDDDDDNVSDGDGDLGDSSAETTGEESGVDNISESHFMNLSDENTFSASTHFDKSAEGVGKDFAAQDDSCMSFEFQADTDSCDPVDTGVALQSDQDKSSQRESFDGSVHGYNDGVDPLYFLDNCDTKAWDTRFTVPTKGVDLLPTCSIIDEIFGQGAFDGKL